MGGAVWSKWGVGGVRVKNRRICMNEEKNSKKMLRTTAKFICMAIIAVLESVTFSLKCYTEACTAMEVVTLTYVWKQILDPVIKVMIIEKRKCQ